MNNNKQDIVKQCPQGPCGAHIPINTATSVSKACDEFFKSRNISYGSSWFHERNKRKELNQTEQGVK